MRAPWLGPAVALGVEFLPVDRLAFGVGIATEVALIGARARVGHARGPRLTGV